MAYISAYLKSKGHTVTLLDTTFGVAREEVVKRAKGAELVGVSVMTLQLDQAKWVTSIVKEATGAPVVWGGNHPTVRPNECIGLDFVDAVCVGEGEEAMAEFAKRVEEGGDITTVRNMWVKSRGEIHKNPVRPLNQDFDELPWPDREIFDPRHLRVNDGSIVSGSRECPYGCGYCINDSLKKLYKGKGKYMRHRSVESLLAEIEMMRDRYGVRVFEFADETFTLRRNWVLEFCKKYRERVNLPFIFQTRCNDVDREILQALKDARCETLSFGVESGNETYRKEVLGRRMSDKVIEEAFGLAKDLGFRVNSFNMVGMPYETEEMILDTIKMNRRLRPHGHNVCIFYPFPGTRLGDLCEEKGWIAKEATGLESYYYDSVLRMPQLDRFTVLSYQKFFPLYLRLPWFAVKPARRLLRPLLEATYWVEKRTRSKVLREMLNNLYWITSAFTDGLAFKKLLIQLPRRLARIVRAA